MFIIAIALSLSYILLFPTLRSKLQVFVSTFRLVVPLTLTIRAISPLFTVLVLLDPVARTLAFFAFLSLLIGSGGEGGGGSACGCGCGGGGLGGFSFLGVAAGLLLQHVYCCFERRERRQRLEVDDEALVAFREVKDNCLNNLLILHLLPHSNKLTPRSEEGVYVFLDAVRFALVELRRVEYTAEKHLVVGAGPLVYVFEFGPYLRRGLTPLDVEILTLVYDENEDGVSFLGVIVPYGVRGGSGGAGIAENAPEILVGKDRFDFVFPCMVVCGGELFDVFHGYGRVGHDCSQIG